MDIADWRKKIDELDRRLVELLSERARAAQEIGRLKRNTNLPIYEPDRERIVFSNVQELNQGPLHDRDLVRIGFEVHSSTGARMTVLGAVGSGIDFDIRILELLPGVQEVHRISSPYKLAGRSFRPEGTIVRLANGVDIGGNEVIVMAGPCSVESREQLFTTAEGIAKAGARVLRGGAFKPRSSPYSFQGHGEEALKLLREAGDKFKLLVISEVMEISQIPMMLPYVDILQVGARNMQNFNL